MENINIKKFLLEDYLPVKIIKAPLINKKVFLYKAIKNNENLIGKDGIDYIEVNKVNKALGTAGERFVFEYEEECVKKYNLPPSKKVRHVSIDEGDGLGYDILSYDSQGNEIFIEVKTTEGEEKTSFYITANELLKSEQAKENYYLYRVYNFDVKNRIGNISVRRGSLKELCITPQVYKVELE